MASSADLIAAAKDSDLHDRMVAILASSGCATPEALVTQRIGQIVAVVVDSDAHQTVADVYAYAVATYRPAPRPGQNPAAVTDAQLRAALRAVGVLDND